MHQRKLYQLVFVQLFRSLLSLDNFPLGQLVLLAELMRSLRKEVEMVIAVCKLWLIW